MRGEGISRRWFSIIGGAVTVHSVPLREVLVRADEDMIIFFSVRDCRFVEEGDLLPSMEM